MEMARKKFSIQLLLLCDFITSRFQTGKEADEVQVKPDEAKMNYVNSEAPAPVAPQADLSSVGAKRQSQRESSKFSSDLNVTNGCLFK